MGIVGDDLHQCSLIDQRAHMGFDGLLNDKIARIAGVQETKYRCPSESNRKHVARRHCTPRAHVQHATPCSAIRLGERLADLGGKHQGRRRAAKRSHLCAQRLVCGKGAEQD